MTTERPRKSQATLAVQPASPSSKRSRFQGLAAPIIRASTVIFPDAASFDARYGDFYDGYTYGLYGTPTSKTLEDQLNALSGASRTVLAPSGQAALSLVLTTFLRPGDHVLLPDNVYGPVRGFASTWLVSWGVDVEFYDPLIAGGIADLLRGRTRLVLVESPGSNTMEIQDIPAIADAAHKRGALVVADVTWATPLCFDAFRNGVDLTIEALSKYASGHGDVLMGSIGTQQEPLFRRIKDMTRHFGLGASPDDCSLVLRGLQTMPLRIDRSAATALSIAEHLLAKAEVGGVLHPALPHDPGHTLWKRDFKGANGVFSFFLAKHLKGLENAFVDALELFALGASWGSARSIVAPQDPSAGRSATAWPHGKVIRLSIGLEDAADLIADLDFAFEHISKLAKSRAQRPKPAA